MKTKRFIFIILLFIFTLCFTSCTFINGFKISSEDVDYKQNYDNLHVSFSGSYRNEIQEQSNVKIKIRITTSDNAKLTYEFNTKLLNIDGKEFEVDTILGLNSIFKANAMDFHNEKITDMKLLSCKMVNNCSNYSAYIWLGIPICIIVVILFSISLINFGDDSKKQLNDKEIN